LSLESQAIEAVQAVIAVEGAQRRKAPGFEPITFFGRNDWWVYHAEVDPKLCDKCAANLKHYLFNGAHLREKFPYLVIVDENTIIANVHPNCRCYLTRLYKIEEPE
jgi:hypothetical protein